MGNHHSHDGAHKQQDDTHPRAENTSLAPSGSKKEKGLSRSASGTDIQDRSQAQLLPVEKLSKILVKRTHEEDHINGITCSAFSLLHSKVDRLFSEQDIKSFTRVFKRYVFPRYPALAEKLFQYLHKQSKAKTDHLGGTAFRQQCEKFLGLMDDETVVNLYVKMYSTPDEKSDTFFMTPDSLRLLLFTAYRVAMDHYADGPQMCLYIQKTLSSVIDSCFHGKTKLSAQFVSHWLMSNCPRLILPLHKYAVHNLATAYRVLDSETPILAQGIELATPVLDHNPTFPLNKSSHTNLLPMSAAWLLAGALGTTYSKPKDNSRPQGPLNGAHGAQGHMFLAKLAGAVPSHWLMLYNSDLHGQGANRFLHHVLAYRGPTLVLFRADNGEVFCVASTAEWRESHLYWGGEESAVLQMQPKFLVIEQGPKMLYLNTTIRGYPQGLRAGKDPRKPVIIVDGGFEKIEYRNIPYSLTNIEVWGCGDPAQREVQLDIKKWQVKEAERQRNVKLSAADWLDHPDRYLLELAGRPQYNNVTTNSQSSQPQN